MDNKRFYEVNMPELSELTKFCMDDEKKIPFELYEKLNVKRGLRDLNGVGVLTGLTRISEVNAKKTVDGVDVPCHGELFYRGYNINDIVYEVSKTGRFGFEKTTYLLLFGELPTDEELDNFVKILSTYRSLPHTFLRDIIMKAPSENMMNSLARSVLTLYSYDRTPDDTSIPNVLRQSLQLISLFPMLSVYSYQTYDYSMRDGNSFFIHNPRPELSTAENILHMLRIDSKYTDLEAQLLDICLILHAEHGGGNNSSFTTRVVSSSGTDTYAAIAAALGSLKGPLHGGANIKVCEMMNDIKENVSDWNDCDEITAYLNKIIKKETFDRKGLVYGIGHAIYSLSDPRARVLKSYVEKLCEEKGLQKEFALYSNVEKLAPDLVAQNRKMYKGISANIDFYSGFVYDMLGLPKELFTPMFAIARIAGWSAHRLEELFSAGKIIRPAYKAVGERREYKRT